MFNITHQLFFASEVNVTEQQTNSWRYNKQFCSTPSWHNNTQTHSAHYTVSHFFQTNTPTQKPTQFPVCSIWMNLLYWNYWTVQLCKEKPNLMYNLFLVHSVNLYMFPAYLGPSSGGTTVCTQFNPTSRTESHLKRMISTNCSINTAVPPDDGPRYAGNI